MTTTNLSAPTVKPNDKAHETALHEDKASLQSTATTGIELMPHTSNYQSAGTFFTHPPARLTVHPSHFPQESYDPQSMYQCFSPTENLALDLSMFTLKNQNKGLGTVKATLDQLELCDSIMALNQKGLPLANRPNPLTPSSSPELSLSAKNVHQHARNPSNVSTTSSSGTTPSLASVQSPVSSALLSAGYATPDHDTPDSTLSHSTTLKQPSPLQLSNLHSPAEGFNITIEKSPISNHETLNATSVSKFLSESDCLFEPSNPLDTIATAEALLLSQQQSGIDRMAIQQRPASAPSFSGMNMPTQSMPGSMESFGLQPPHPYPTYHGDLDYAGIPPGYPYYRVHPNMKMGYPMPSHYAYDMYPPQAHRPPFFIPPNSHLPSRLSTPTMPMDPKQEGDTKGSAGKWRQQPSLRITTRPEGLLASLKKPPLSPASPISAPPVLGAPDVPFGSMPPTHPHLVSSGQYPYPMSAHPYSHLASASLVPPSPSSPNQAIRDKKNKARIKPMRTSSNSRGSPSLSCQSPTTPLSSCSSNLPSPHPDATRSDSPVTTKAPVMPTAVTAPKTRTLHPAIYKCTFEGCPKVFTRPYNLRSHMKIHTGEKLFECDYCDAKFTRGHDLKRHTRLHTNERPFACRHCDKAFSRSDALKRHQKVEMCGLDEHGNPLPPKDQADMNEANRVLFEDPLEEEAEDLTQFGNF